jgi:hypothetical protein
VSSTPISHLAPIWSIGGVYLWIAYYQWTAGFGAKRSKGNCLGCCCGVAFDFRQRALWHIAFIVSSIFDQIVGESLLIDVVSKFGSQPNIIDGIVDDPPSVLLLEVVDPDCPCVVVIAIRVLPYEDPRQVLVVAAPIRSFQRAVRSECEPTRSGVGQSGLRIASLGEVYLCYFAISTIDESLSKWQCHYAPDSQKARNTWSETFCVCVLVKFKFQYESIASNGFRTRIITRSAVYRIHPIHYC